MARRRMGQEALRPEATGFLRKHGAPDDIAESIDWPRSTGIFRRLIDPRLEAVTRQLAGKNVMAKTGTLVDATVMASASITKDEEARWVGHRRKAAVHGYKAHVATDAEGGIVRRIEMTPANVNDGRMLGAVLQPDPGRVHADLAYARSRNEILIRDAGGSSRLPGRAIWGGAERRGTRRSFRRPPGRHRRQAPLPSAMARRERLQPA